MLSDLDLNELKWDHDGSYWYSRDSYNITPADMREYARKLKAENTKLREVAKEIVDGEDYYMGKASANEYDSIIEHICTQLREALEGKKDENKLEPCN